MDSSLEIERRIYEMYCSSPATIESLYYKGKRYSRIEISFILDKFLIENDCSCIDLLSDKGLDHRLNDNVQEKMSNYSSMSTNSTKKLNKLERRYS